MTPVARRGDRLEELAEQLRRDHGVGAQVIACDLAEPEARSALIRQVTASGRHVGVLVNNAGFASTAGFQPLPWSAGYSAAEAHTLAFSEALHHGVGRRGVTVMALCLGPVRTEFWEVAGDQPIENSMPSLMWVRTDAVTDAAIRGLLRGHRVGVPGLAVRASILWSAFVPRGIQLPVLAASMRPKGR